MTCRGAALEVPTNLSGDSGFQGPGSEAFLASGLRLAKAGIRLGARESGRERGISGWGWREVGVEEKENLRIFFFVDL